MPPFIFEDNEELEVCGTFFTDEGELVDEVFIGSLPLPEGNMPTELKIGNFTYRRTPL